MVAPKEEKEEVSAHVEKPVEEEKTAAPTEAAVEEVKHEEAPKGAAEGKEAGLRGPTDEDVAMQGA